MLCWYERLSSWHQEVLVRYLTQCVWSKYRLLDTLPLYLYYELLVLHMWPDCIFKWSGYARLAATFYFRLILKLEFELRVYGSIRSIIWGFLKISIPCYYVANLFDLDIYSNHHCVISNYKLYQLSAILTWCNVFNEADPTIFLSFTIPSYSMWCALTKNWHVIGIRLISCLH